MKYTCDYHVMYYHCDWKKTLRPDRCAAYMQETALAALEKYGPTPAYLTDHDQAFFLSKISYRFYDDIRPNDIIQISTWPLMSRGVTFPRCYTAERDGEIVAEAYSDWALLGMSDRKLYSLADIKLDFEFHDQKPSIAQALKVRCPSDMSHVGSVTVQYSSLDENRHMNNAYYINLICDHIPAAAGKLPFEGERISGLDINHRSEARFGETLDIYHAFDSGKHFLRAVKRMDGGVCPAEHFSADMICFEAALYSEKMNFSSC